MVTPNFYVFEMYAAHQGGQSLRTEINAPNVHYTRDNKPASFWGLNGSASRKGNVVTLTLVNTDLLASTQTQVSMRGLNIRSGKGWVLAAADMHAHNTFENKNAVKLADLRVDLSEKMLNVSIPPASVTKLELTLG